MQVRYPIFMAIAAVLLEVSSAEYHDTGRIIGGESATKGQFPWMVALFVKDKFKCSASIIGPRTVLTAAHCVVKKNGETEPAASFHAIANYRKSADKVRIDFESAIPHPKYALKQDVYNDIAILKTTEPIVFSDNIKPISIASSNTPKKKYATAMGWGLTKPRNLESVPDKLQYVKVSIISREFCSKSYPGTKIHKKKICAGQQHGICMGDSGGPLVLDSDSDSPIQIGIASYVSAIYGCGSAAPGVFTRVSSYNDFISKNRNQPLRTEARGRCPCCT